MTCATLVGRRRSERRLGLFCAAAILPAGVAHAQSGPTYRPEVQEDILVTAERQAPTLPLLTQPLLDTPQTITIIPSDTIELQGLNDLRDVLRNDPSVASHADEDNAQGTNVQIRGFTARNDLYLDGQVDIGRYYRDPFWLQEVDVLTGPSSVLFGRGSTGGAVNQVSRKPIARTVMAGTLAFGTDGLKRLTADLNLPVTATAAFRLDAMAHDDSVAGRALVGTRRIGVAPSFSVGMGGPTTLTLSFLHQSQWDRPDYGVPWLDIAGNPDSHPADVPKRTYYGFKSDYSDVTADIATTTLRHEFPGGIVLRDQFRYAYYTRDYRATNPSVDTVVGPTTPLSAIAVTRTIRGGSSTESVIDDQLDMTARFSTFGIDHMLVIGGSIGRQTSDPTVLSFSGVPDTTLLDPDPYAAFTGIKKVKSTVHFSADTAAGFMADTLKLGKRWQLSGAARIDSFAADYRVTAPTLSALRHTDVLPSWRTALIYKPVPNVSAYVFYGTSFDPSAENLSLSASTADLAPERSHSLEGGVKWNPNNQFQLSAALFRTVMDNMREPSPDDPSFQILAGTARAQGIELSAQGRINRRWLVLAGYTLLDTKILSSPNADRGARLQNAPHDSLRLFTAYDVTDRLELGGGISYSSSRVPASLVDGNGFHQVVSGYWDGSVTARYAITHGIALQVNVDNIANTRFYDGLDDNHVNIGAARSARFSLIVNE
jgi:catecholate siderophore receptor